MRARSSHGGSHGFTLIELVVTIAIIALLSTVAMPLAELTAKRSKEQELRNALMHIRDAIDAYKQAYEQQRLPQIVGATGYPPNLDLLWQGVDDMSLASSGKKIYFLRRLPRDPMFPDTTTQAAATWGLRSYASPPDNPQPGKDVFDVYSLSDKAGLNGVPLREW